MQNTKIYLIPTSSYSSSPSVSSKSSKRMLLSPFLILATLFTAVFMAGCASENLKAPCPDYGKHCDQTPVNSWDTTTV